MNTQERPPFGGGSEGRAALAAHVVKHFSMSIDVSQYGDIELAEDDGPQLLAEQLRLLNHTFSSNFARPDGIAPVTWYDANGGEYFGGADEIPPVDVGTALMVLAAQSLALRRELEEIRGQFGALLMYSVQRDADASAPASNPTLRVVT